MRKLTIALLVMAVLCLGGVPVWADSIPSNWEVFDEVSTVAEIGGSDALWGSKHLDVGLMVGVTNYKNPFNNEKAGSYIMIKGDVKGIRAINRLWNWFKNR